MKKRAKSGKSLQIASMLVLISIAVATGVLLLVPGTDPVPSTSETPQPAVHAAETSGEILRTEPFPAMTTGVARPTEPAATVAGTLASAGATGRATVRNPFIADTQPAVPAGSTGTLMQSAPTTSLSTAYTTSARAAATTGRPRYASESAFFLAKIPLLREALQASRFITAVHEVDAANPAVMVVLTDTEARARNLDGFFRIAADKDGETWGGAPLAMGIDRLYTEAGRDRAYADGSFCSDGLDVLLDASVRTMLGGAYEPGVTAFVLERYRAGMTARLAGEPRTASALAASFTWLDAIYREGFVSYVEFYPNPEASKG